MSEQTPNTERLAQIEARLAVAAPGTWEESQFWRHAKDDMRALLKRVRTAEADNAQAIAQRSAALRTVEELQRRVDTVEAERDAAQIHEMTATGFDFAGCSDWNGPAGNCACETWEPTACSACGEDIHDGQTIRERTLSASPWLPDDSEHTEWETLVWHVDCDAAAAALSVPVVEPKEES